MKRFVIITCIAGAVALALWAGWSSIFPAPVTEPSGPPPASGVVPSATLVIFDGTKDIFHGVVPLAPTSTVFALVQTAAASSGLPFAYRAYPGMGLLITKIGGKINGKGGAYWQYWVNGAYATEGADHTAVYAGDRIEWKFTASQQ